jgi:hypothetical protein
VGPGADRSAIRAPSAISGPSNRRVPVVPAVGGEVKAAPEISRKRHRDRDVPPLFDEEALADTVKAYAEESPRVNALPDRQASRRTGGEAPPMVQDPVAGEQPGRMAPEKIHDTEGWVHDLGATMNHSQVVGS